MNTFLLICILLTYIADLMLVILLFPLLVPANMVRLVLSRISMRESNLG